MTTSSARPDAIEEGARGFSSSGARLHDVARQVWSAADAYAAHCADAPVDLTSPSRAGATLADARDLASDLRRVADAFRTADRTARTDWTGWTDRTTVGGANHPTLGGLATVTDVALSGTILARHAALGAELTGPTRTLARRGEALAARMIDALDTGGAVGAAAVLHGAAPDDLTEPVFAAAVVNTLGPHRMRSITEELARTAFDWRLREAPFLHVARLWTTATHTLDLPPRAPRLQTDLLATLLASAGGRNALRALTGGSDRGAGERYLRQVWPPLLTRSARDDAELSATYHLLTGADRQGDPDAPMIDAVARVPDLAVELFLRRPGSVDDRTTALLDLGPGAQGAVARLLGQVLDHERFAADHHDRDRTAILRATYSWVVDHGPDAVSAPLAQFLADTLMTDLPFYLGRIDTDRRPDLETVLQAVTEHERPWMTALIAFQHHGIAIVRETLHGTADERLGALDAISRLEGRFEAAASATDRPVDHNAGFFTLLNATSGVALRLVRTDPVTGAVLGALVDRGLEAWHGATVPDPDDHEARTRLVREALRRRIWVVIADDPGLGTELNWSVGGVGGDRHQHLGSQIGGVDDLLALTGSDADLDELAGWAAHQPDHLQAMVAAYLAGAA